MMRQRIFMGCLAVCSLLASSGCLTSQEKVALDTRSRDLQQRLDDITAQLMTVSEQLENRPAAIQGTGLQPAPVTIVPQAPLPDPRDQFRAIERKNRPVYKAPRRRTTRRKASPRHHSQRDLQRKHIRVGKSVRTVQLALREAKCYPGKIDGKIGEKTIGGIRAFQRKNRLKADGVVGSATWKKLEVYVPAGGAAAPGGLSDFK